MERTPRCAWRPLLDKSRAPENGDTRRPARRIHFHPRRQNIGSLGCDHRRKGVLTMSKLQLPNVTLMMVDVICHDLARLSMEDSMRAADFGAKIVFSDQQIGDWPDVRW